MDICLHNNLIWYSLQYLSQKVALMSISYILLRFSWGKILNDRIALCKEIDILQLCWWSSYLECSSRLLVLPGPRNLCSYLVHRHGVGRNGNGCHSPPFCLDIVWTLCSNSNHHLFQFHFLQTNPFFKAIGFDTKVKIITTWSFLQLAGTLSALKI